MIWRPIETAPKDGTWFLAVCEKRNRNPRHVRELKWNGFCWASRCSGNHYHRGEVSAWMPCPDPPKP